MSNVYCSNCGTKHLTGAKFCSSCGNKISIYAKAKIGGSSAMKTRHSDAENDECETPDTFVRPAKLEYEIENSTNRYSVKEVISRPPSKNEFRDASPSKSEVFSSKEDYLKYSMKQCSSSKNLTDVDED